MPDSEHVDLTGTGGSRLDHREDANICSGRACTGLLRRLAVLPNTVTFCQVYKSLA
jgi:hypothetical protein